MRLKVLLVRNDGNADEAACHALAEADVDVGVMAADDAQAALQSLRERSCDLLVVVDSTNAAGVRGLCDLIQAQRIARETQEALHVQVESTATLVNVVSHDMRNLLHAVSLSASYLERRRDMPEGTLKAVARIKSSGKWALRLIRDLVVFTQASLGKGVPLMAVQTDLCELGQQIVDDFAEARPDHPVSLTCEPAPLGTWDPDRLAQVLSNLLWHAMDHAAPGVPATLRIVPDGRCMRFDVHCPAADGSHGPQAPSGAFALDIVAHIVRAHHGTLEVHADTTGPRFTVRLPHRGHDDRVSDTLEAREAT